MEECHRRVGRVGPEYQSSRRGRGEQRRPLRRRVGNMGACPPPLRGRSAVVAQNAACTSGGPKIDSHVDFDATAAWRHHVSMRPSSRSQSAAITALAACELFRVKRDCAKSHKDGFGASSVPTRRPREFPQAEKTNPGGSNQVYILMRVYMSKYNIHFIRFSFCELDSVRFCVNFYSHRAHCQP